MASVLAIFCAALAGCGGTNADTSSDRSAGAAPAYYPGGLGAYSSVDGLYADKWTSREVTFIVAIPRNAQRMTLRIDVPVGRYKRGEEGLVIRLGDGPPQKRLQLPFGPQTVTVPVPGKLRGKTTKVSVLMRATFVPAKVETSSDRRELGVLFTNVSFE
ncbi:MAG: hypothetical protein M3N13_05490 [Candidatus Eremiobacteraeota bacterium]|nr:hypothetical protein [Candidatus Eremiobacteraeota bacterium]